MATFTNRRRSTRWRRLSAAIAALALSGAAYAAGLWSAPANGSSNTNAPAHTVATDVCRPTVPGHFC